MKQEQDELSCRVYVTDALRAIAHNTSAITKEGLVMTVRYADMIHREPETRTPDEIIGGIREKLRKLGGDDSA